MNRLNIFIGRKKLLIIFTVVAVLFGLMIFWYFNNIRQKSHEEEFTVEIYTAAEDIFAGAKISEEMLVSEKISMEVFNESFLTDKKDIYGKTAQNDIKKGEIISSSKLEGKYEQENNYLRFSSYIPGGSRAVTIPVIYYGQAALINRGDKVDVISTYYDTEKDKLVSITVLKYKEIILVGGSNNVNNADLSANQSTSPDKNNGPVFQDIFSSNGTGSANTNLLLLTFYLAPEEVESIMLSMQLGTLNLAICPE